MSGALRDDLLVIPNLPHPDAPDGVGGDDNPVVKGPFLPESFPEHQRVPHWEAATATRHPRQRARHQDLRGDVHDAARRRGHARHGRCASSPSIATPTRSRRSARRRWSRRRRSRRPVSCRSSPTTRSRSSATTCGASRPPRCRSRRSTPTRCSTRRQLPLRLMAYTPCYRREAGSAGRDTRGMLRAHEFDKVEILALATPEQAPALLDEMVGRAERTDRRARAAVPDHRDLHRRHGPEPPPQLRHRGVRAGLRPVARGVVGQLVQRLPGAPRQRPLPPVDARRRRARSSCTRSTARRSPCRACGRRSSRTDAQADGSIVVPEVLRPVHARHRRDRCRVTDRCPPT